MYTVLDSSEFAMAVHCSLKNRRHTKATIETNAPGCFVYKYFIHVQYNFVNFMPLNK